MATGVQVWSQTPASNATADSNINWAEGMAPSAVNDSARSVMASVAKWNNDNNGTLVTSGSSTAYTVATNQIESALTAGYTVTVQFHATSDLNATLAVDGLAAKPLQLVSGTNVPFAALPANSVRNFTYSSTGSGQWIATPTPVTPPQGLVSAIGPFNGLGTNTNAYTMMGLGTHFTFTPLYSTRAYFAVQFYSSSNTAGGGAIQVEGTYGTGTAPTGGAALTGTVFSGALVGFNNTLNGQIPFTLVGCGTGLTPGTAYWVDVAALCGANLVYTMSVTNASFYGFEI